jgi:hypothetical protein
MAAFVKYDIFSEDLAKKVHDLNADTLKVMLSNTAPNVTTNALRSQVTELAGGNGYTSGGDDTQNTTSRTTNTTSVLGVDTTVTCSAATVGPFRYDILYNDTPASPLDPLIGYWDYGSSITLNPGESFTTDFGASMFTIA